MLRKLRKHRKPPPVRGPFGGALERGIWLAGFTKERFASFVGKDGIDPSQVSRYLTGQDVPNWERLRELAAALPKELGEAILRGFVNEHIEGAKLEALLPDEALAKASEYEEAGMPEHGLGLINAALPQAPPEALVPLQDRGTRFELKLLLLGSADRRVWSLRSEAARLKRHYDFLCAKQLDGRVRMESGVPLKKVLATMDEAENYGVDRLSYDRRMAGRVYVVRRDKAHALIAGFLNGVGALADVERAVGLARATAKKFQDPLEKARTLHVQARGELALEQSGRAKEALDDADALGMTGIELALKSEHLRAELGAVQGKLDQALEDFLAVAAAATRAGDLRALQLAERRIAQLNRDLRSRDPRRERRG